MTSVRFLFAIATIVLCLESTLPPVRSFDGRVRSARLTTSYQDIKTISATVVAYDLGVEQGDGSCKQTAIAREKASKRDDSHRYLILRHQTSCMKLIPEESLNVNRERSFKLTRDTKCDQTFEQLQYFIRVSPTGTVTKTPRLKTVQGSEEINVPAAKKLRCYLLTSSPDVFQR